mmetsp:Transcript_36435/g.91998  ORF Transcript_36435/g.91998 Transcript_36435/m.91998 type:complete len:202 (+) Transcript_36435:1060-1665(+)
MAGVKEAGRPGGGCSPCKPGTASTHPSSRGHDPHAHSTPGCTAGPDPAAAACWPPCVPLRCDHSTGMCENRSGLCSASLSSGTLYCRAMAARVSPSCTACNLGSTCVTGSAIQSFGCTSQDPSSSGLTAANCSQLTPTTLAMPCRVSPGPTTCMVTAAHCSGCDDEGRRLDTLLLAAATAAAACCWDRTCDSRDSCCAALQ